MAHSKPIQTNEQSASYEHKMKCDGTPNPRYVDLLDEDPPIAGQKFACLSFVSPEEILKSKNEFYFQQFLNSWDMNKSLEKFNQFVNFISFKYNIDAELIQSDLKEFVSSEEDAIRSASSIADDYKNYVERFSDKLDEQFGLANEFATTTRGVKVRGVFSTQPEAEMKCKQLRELDPSHDVYVGTVGIWMPFHPNAYKTGKVEYLEDELNQLMQEKNKNEDKAKLEFEKRIRETKEDAIKNNITKAEQSGNLLTQTIDDNGELINIKNIQDDGDDIRTPAPVTNTKGGLEASRIASSNVMKDMFASENVSPSTDFGID